MPESIGTSHDQGGQLNILFSENVSVPLGFFFVEPVGPFIFRCQAPPGLGL